MLQVTTAHDRLHITNPDGSRIIVGIYSNTEVRGLLSDIELESSLRGFEGWHLIYREIGPDNKTADERWLGSYRYFDDARTRLGQIGLKPLIPVEAG